MKLKTVEVDGKTYAEVQDGKPVYVDEGGKETAFDAPYTIATISRLNGEAKGHREAKEAAEAKLKAFEGITDPKAAAKALETLKNLDDKKLIDAGEVDKVKSEIVKVYEEKLTAANAAREAAERSLYDEKIGGAFARSKFVTDKLAIPADMVQAAFGRHFKMQDGKVVATDPNGNQIYSRSKPGEPASFEEALESLVEAYPHRDAILRGTGSNGAGVKPSNGAGAVGQKTMTRAEFDALPQTQRAAKMREGFRLTE